MFLYQIFLEAKSYIPSICFTTSPTTWKECTRLRNTSRWDTCEVLFLGKLIPIFSFKIQLRRHKALEHTKFPDAFPSKWQGWRLTVSEEKAFSDRLTGHHFRWLKIIDGWIAVWIKIGESHDDDDWWKWNSLKWWESNFNVLMPPRWVNYQGVKEGPVKNPFKPRLF